MAYVSSDDIIARLGNDTALQLTTDSGSTIDTALIDDFIAGAEGMVESHVSRRVSVPVAQTDYPKTYQAVRRAVIAITIYDLAGRRPPITEARKTANDQAIEWLKGLVEGTVDLPDKALNEPRSSWGSAERNALDMER